jgi:hypothetical protein
MSRRAIARCMEARSTEGYVTEAPDVTIQILHPQHVPLREDGAQRLQGRLIPHRDGRHWMAFAAASFV